MYFPLKFRPPESYHEAPRKFGARRDHGARKHAGCDLYAPLGTPVYSVEFGKVIAIYEFYLTSWAVEVDHGNFIVRYGEVQKNVAPGITVGAEVLPGDLIGYVGRLKGLALTMLHFEMYDKSSKGPLTDRKRPPYQRRSDLLDPTTYLDEALMQGGAYSSGIFKKINGIGFLNRCIPP